jgi:hypothetical protein
LKKIIFILFFITSVKAIGCSCGVSTFSKQFINADIVVKAKVISFSPEWKIENQYEQFTTEIEIIETYKGSIKSKIIKIFFSNDSSCSLFMPLNSEWILFAYSSSKENEFYTNMCSGSKQINKEFDESLYPKYNIQYQKSINNLTKLLTNLKANNIEISNKLNILNSCSYYNFLISQQDLKTDKDYAFYKIILNSNFEIKKIKVISGFNRKFDENLKKEIIENNGWINVYGRNKKIPEKTEWLIIIKRSDEFTYDTIKYTEITYDP